MNDNYEDLIAEAREWPRDGVNEGPLINSLADALEASDARLREAEAVIVRARGWALKPITGFTVENQMAEVADALATYKPTTEDR